MTQLYLEQQVTRAIRTFRTELFNRACEVLKRNDISTPHEVINTDFNWVTGKWILRWEWSIYSYKSIEASTIEECIDVLNEAVYNFIVYGTVNNPFVSGPQGS